MTRELQIGVSGRHWPFSRGLVAESLLNAGASPEVASAVARRVEAQLRAERRGVVPPASVKAVMVDMARAVGSMALAETVAAQTAAFDDILVVAKKGELPFSRGVLSRNLEDTGLPPREAYAVASQIDVRLRQQGIKSLSVGEIDDLVERVLSETYGDHLKQTYPLSAREPGTAGRARRRRRCAHAVF